MLFPGDACRAKFRQLSENEFLSVNAVGRMPLLRLGSVDASAGRGVFAGEVGSEDPRNVAAVAFALPSAVFVGSNYSKFTKAFAE